MRQEIRPLLKLAVPVAASQLANVAMQLVDTLFIGRLGTEPLGGVSVGSVVFSTAFIAGMGLLFGLDFPISRAFGAGKPKEANSYLVQGFYLATAVSIPLTVLLYVLAMNFDVFGVAPGVTRQAEIYLKILSLGLWPSLVFTAFRQYLQGMGVALPVLWIILVANVVNALGNYAFVFGHFGSPALGIAGSALGTNVARLFMALALIAYTFMRDRRLGLGLIETSLKYSREKLREIFRLGFPAALQITLEVGVFATATLLVGRLGATPLAAHQIVLQIATFSFMIPMGISSAAAVRVAQALGAGKPERAVRAGWTALALSGSFMACSGISMYIFSEPILSAFTRDSWVIGLGSSLLLVAAVFQLSDGIQVVGTGVLRGLGNTRSSMIANLIGHWVLGLPVGCFLCFGMGWGVHGLWIGLALGLTFVALSLVWVWKRSSRASAAEVALA